MKWWLVISRGKRSLMGAEQSRGALPSLAELLAVRSRCIQCQET
jgi:hypothetical protein